LRLIAGGLKRADKAEFHVTSFERKLTRIESHILRLRRAIGHAVNWKGRQHG
jgi:hypothetical protein